MGVNGESNQYRRRWEAYDSRLRQALKRLVEGNPTHPDLQDGRYRLNVSTLGKEAGTSRNVIYHSHPEVLEDLKAAKKRPAKVLSKKVATDDKLRELRKEVSELKFQRKRLATENAGLQARLLDVETNQGRIAFICRKCQATWVQTSQ